MKENRLHTHTHRHTDGGRGRRVENQGFHLRKETMLISMEAKRLRQPSLWRAPWDFSFLTHSLGITWLPGKEGPAAENSRTLEELSQPGIFPASEDCFHYCYLRNCNWPFTRCLLSPGV